ALATEQLVRPDVHPHVQVAGRTTALARHALAGQPDPLPVGHAGGDLHGDRPGLRRHAGAPAVRARVVDDRPGPAALPARLAERERTLVAGDQAGAQAGRALPRRGARAGAVATAGTAGGRAGQLQRDGHPVHGLREVEGHLGLHVGPAGRRRTPAGPGVRTTATAEQTAEQVTQTAAGTRVRPGGALPEQVVQVEGRATGAAAARTEPAREAAARHATAEQRPRLVVLAPARLVREHPVRLGDLLEPGLRLGVTRVLVRVQLAGELAVRLLDVRTGGVLGDAQGLVVVLLHEVLGAHRTR